LLTTVIGIPMGLTHLDGVLSTPPSIEPIFFQFQWEHIFTKEMVIVVFTFLFVDMFDTIGTLVGVTTKAGMVTKDGKIPHLKQAFLVDAIGTTAGAMLGTSTITTFVESASGVGEGGRSGLTSFVTAVCFLLSLFLAPFFLAVPGAATAPVLILVGLMMMSSVKKWLAELGQKIKKLFTTDTVKAAATRMAATNVEKKAESRANEGNKNIIRVQFKTIIRANYEKITLSKYSQYIRASQNEILTLMKSLANNHNTVFHALRSKSSDVSLPDIRTDALNKYMDISSNGSTISVNMAASEVTLSVAPSEIKLFSNLVWVTEVNNNNLNTLLKRVASENQAIIAMDGVDPALVKLAGTLQVQLIKLANICKLVFLTEINRAITEVGKAT
jgi:AGZA family xanthine/uracil permease-like MFS transporter